jgi:selenium-binding protein 1
MRPLGVNPLSSPANNPGEDIMASLRPDPTFYPSPRQAMKAPAETLAYVVAFDPTGRTPDAMTVVDLDPESGSYGEIVGQTDMPNAGDELHHFGWNACSSCLCPNAPHPHSERRYLVVPGLRSSRLHILDVKPDPRKPKIVKVIEAEELAEKTGYSRPHTIHCGPEGIYVSALGNPAGDGPGGIFLMDHETFDIRGRWEMDRGPQELAYDFWWHLGHDTVVSSEWGTPNMIENGIVPELLLGNKYGHKIHFWDLHKRKHIQEIDIGPEHQMALELRPAHDPTKAHGFMGVVVSTANLAASIWTWYRDGDQWAIKKVIEIPPEPAEADDLPPLLQGFGAVPPLVTDIDLSMDDRFLYVSCWGTGDFIQYDVSDPMNPKETGRIRLGGIVSRASHPAATDTPLNGGPQMVEISRDGKRVYFTNSLYGAWDEQFYPDGIDGWMVKLAVDTERGGMTLDKSFFLQWPKSHRPHQIRLEGGDCSSDSYCYP